MVTLTNIAILALKGLSVDARERIATACGVSSHTINRWIRDVDDNLTKAAALKQIRKETGLVDSQILTEGLDDANVTSPEPENNTTNR